jgi:hypothetical protein
LLVAPLLFLLLNSRQSSISPLHPNCSAPLLILISGTNSLPATRPSPRPPAATAVSNSNPMDPPHNFKLSIPHLPPNPSSPLLPNFTM